MAHHTKELRLGHCSQLCFLFHEQDFLFTLLTVRDITEKYVKVIFIVIGHIRDRHLCRDFYSIFAEQDQFMSFVQYCMLVPQNVSSYAGGILLPLSGGNDEFMK